MGQFPQAKLITFNPLNRFVEKDYEVRRGKRKRTKNELPQLGLLWILGNICSSRKRLGASFKQSRAKQWVLSGREVWSCLAFTKRKWNLKYIHKDWVTEMLGLCNILDAECKNPSPFIQKIHQLIQKWLFCGFLRRDKCTIIKVRFTQFRLRLLLNYTFLETLLKNIIPICTKY